MIHYYSELYILFAKIFSLWKSGEARAPGPSIVRSLIVILELKPIDIFH